ncbi:hypothetical protein [Pseudonocardia cypriaca]|uniref:Uncharacterized protein n=1 Tax=Pseudonocardia cypriaca TaxID=882449 RepID=A0A543FV61_9PSEU|nr:hypothetical protein [Pseudonocardia cypriaca]TQM37711.1 hypothetical protein FB388_4929 [Pseudonocardia cypriaca]
MAPHISEAHPTGPSVAPRILRGRPFLRAAPPKAGLTTMIKASAQSRRKQAGNAPKHRSWGASRVAGQADRREEHARVAGEAVVYCSR